MVAQRLPSSAGANTSVMPSDSAHDAQTIVRLIELRGHILDSGIFARVLSLLTDYEQTWYYIEEFETGQTKNDVSYARLRILAHDAATKRELLDRLRDVGATVLTDHDVSTEPASADGILPDLFYATTNFPTEVRIGGSWLPVALPEMDCAIVIEETGPRTVAPSDVSAGQRVVVGHEGVRVQMPQRARQKAVFEFMASAVSSEKPRQALLAEVARELIAVLQSGKRVLLVGGPAIVHTGAAPYLAELIRDGYVNAIFAGNALAVHDMEAQFFGTSLGVNLHDAFPAEEGHVHHLRTVNGSARRAASRTRSKAVCSAAV
jgi:lysine-ketoglutarate reductase/saccharopine dehydrogenase-like protein (TIGR00300 family)